MYSYESSAHSRECECEDCLDRKMRTVQLQSCAVAGNLIVQACNHYMMYCLKRPVCDSALSGPSWVREIWCGHERRFFQNMRMRKPVLQKLIESLVQIDGLPCKIRHVPLEESLAIFLLVIGQGVTYPVVEERLQRSSETVSNHFHMVLNAVCRFGMSLIRPLTGYFDDVPVELVNNSVGWPYFRDCVGAIDGTHITLHVPEGMKVPWINRKGVTSTNVLAVCDFNMCIIFASVGMEGSMHDCRVLSESMRHQNMDFPHPPHGKYYLADARYPLMQGFLTPYKNTRYHLPKFRSSRNFANSKEQFNYRHSSVRNVIERTFGVLKKRWRVLNYMSMMDLDTQIKIIWAYITIHNFIRRFDSGDIELLGDIPSEDIELSSIYHRQADSGITTNPAESHLMEATRERIRLSLP